MSSAPHRYRVTPLLAAVAYLAAAMAPCPPAVDSLPAETVAPFVSGFTHPQAPSDLASVAPHDHHHARPGAAQSHAAKVQSPAHHHEHGSPHQMDERSSSRTASNETTFTAPCPCGCDKPTGSRAIAKRLGPVVLPSSDPMPPHGLAQVQDELIQQIPDVPPSLPDAIPITA